MMLRMMVTSCMSLPMMAISTMIHRMKFGTWVQFLLLCANFYNSHCCPKLVEPIFHFEIPLLFIQDQISSLFQIQIFCRLWSKHSVRKLCDSRFTRFSYQRKVPVSMLKKPPKRGKNHRKRGEKIPGGDSHGRAQPSAFQSPFQGGQTGAEWWYKYIGHVSK